jgi:hypothetical protein
MRKFREWVNLKENNDPTQMNQMASGGETPLANAESPTIPSNSGSETEDLLRKLAINPMLKRRLMQVVEELHSLAQEDKQLTPPILMKIVTVMMHELSGVGLNKQQAVRGARRPDVF